MVRPQKTHPICPKAATVGGAPGAFPVPIADSHTTKIALREAPSGDLGRGTGWEAGTDVQGVLVRHERVSGGMDLDKKGRRGYPVAANDASDTDNP